MIVKKDNLCESSENYVLREIWSQIIVVHQYPQGLCL